MSAEFSAEFSVDLPPGHGIFTDAAGVIFDMNGVLVDDESLQESVFTSVLSSYGLTLTHERYQATILGQTDANGVARLAAAYGIPLSCGDIDAIVRAKERLYRARLSAEGASYVAAGVQPLVSEFAARGMRLAIASAAPAAEVEAWLEILSLRHSFDPVLSGESAPGAKPNPAVYEAIRAAWGVPAHVCVVIDDHPANIAIARALGMRAVGITSNLPASAFAQAHIVVGGLADLTNMVRKQ